MYIKKEKINDNTGNSYINTKIIQKNKKKQKKKKAEMNVRKQSHPDYYY